MSREPSVAPRAPSVRKTATSKARATTSTSRPGSAWWNLPRAGILASAAMMFLLHFIHVGLDLGRFFLSSDITVVVPATVGAVVVVSSKRPWAYLVGGLLVLLFPLLAITGGALAKVGDPTLGIESFSNLLALLLLATVIPAIIMGFRQARQGSLRPLGQALRSSGHGMYSWLVLAIFIGAVSQSLLASSVADDAGTAGFDFTPASIFEITMEDLEFVPGTVPLSAGEVHQLRIKNEDATFHTLTYVRGGVEYNHDLAAGDATDVLVLFEEPGTFNFWCIPHTDGTGDARRGMVGTFQIS